MMKINNEISKIIEEAYKRDEEIINQNRELLEEIVKKLEVGDVPLDEAIEEFNLLNTLFF